MQVTIDASGLVATGTSEAAPTELRSPREQVEWSNRQSEIRAARHEAEYQDRHAKDEAALAGPFALDPIVELAKASSRDADVRAVGMSHMMASTVAARMKTGQAALVGQAGAMLAASASAVRHCDLWDDHGPHADRDRFCTSCGGARPADSAA